MKKIEYVIFDADNLIDKLIGYKCADNVEILKGTKEFILTFYDALEKYRKEKNADEIVVSISTIRDDKILHAYERLLDLLNDKENILFGNGYCNYKGTRALMPYNSLNDYSYYVINSGKNENYKISTYYNDLRYLGLSNVIIIGDYTYDEFNKVFKSIENEYHLRWAHHLNNPTKSHILLDNDCFYKDSRVYSNRKNVIDGINMLSSNLDFDEFNVVGEWRTWLTGYQNIRFFEDGKRISKVKKLK